MIGSGAGNSAGQAAVFLPKPSETLFHSCNSQPRTQPIYRIHITIEKIAMDMKAIQDVLNKNKSPIV